MIYSKELKSVRYVVYKEIVMMNIHTVRYLYVQFSQMKMSRATHIPVLY